MKILLFSANPDYADFLKFCFPCVTLEVTHNYDDFRRSLQIRHFDLICYHCNPMNSIQSFNRLTDLLEMHLADRFVALSEGALLESQTVALRKYGIRGIVSITADSHEAMHAMQRIFLGECVFGISDDIAKRDSVAVMLSEQKRKIRKLNTVGGGITSKAILASYLC